jgi:hypothetical protein
MPADSVDSLNEAESARAEMHRMLDELDRARQAHATGAATIAQLQVATEKTYDATERYLAIVRALSKSGVSRGTG